MPAGFASPLRYPGGKSSLTSFLAETIRLNHVEGGTYAEPYAGGAGAALNLLFSERVSDIRINDKDPRVCAMWASILNECDQFLRLLERTPVDVAAWRKQKQILKHHKQHSRVEAGFAFFYLNRCNRSGVPNGGPIGGIDQTGNFLIDARFNKAELRNRIEKIHMYRERISVRNQDGVSFLKSFSRAASSQRSLVYMDPPYFRKAHTLYDFYFDDSDHQRLADYLSVEAEFRWVMSYDDTSKARSLYTGTKKRFSKQYSLRVPRAGRELILASANCLLPRITTT